MEAGRQTERAVSLLIVEDDQVIREVLAMMIPKKFPGLAVYFADGGKAGVEEFRRHKPEIVVTDIQMAEMDGLEMAGAIKAIKEDTRLIALTAYGAARYRDEMDRIGFHSCLPKPIEFARLFAVIERCIAEITGAPAGS